MNMSTSFWSLTGSTITLKIDKVDAYYRRSTKEYVIEVIAHTDNVSTIARYTGKRLNDVYEYLDENPMF